MTEQDSKLVVESCPEEEPERHLQVTIRPLSDTQGDHLPAPP